MASFGAANTTARAAVTYDDQPVGSTRLIDPVLRRTVCAYTMLRPGSIVRVLQSVRTGDGDGVRRAGYCLSANKMALRE